METLQRIITEATSDIIKTLHKGDDNWLEIEQKVMSAVASRVVNNNKMAKANDEPRISMPQYLSFSQIADILNAVMTIKVIVDGDSDSELLGIYNGEIYDTNYNNLLIAAAALNNKMGKRDFDELIARLMLICERVPLNKDRDLIAVNNGIYNYRKQTLMEFSEDHVFLAKSSVNYNENATNKTFPDGWNVEDWIQEIAANEEVAQLLWEIIGSVLRPYVKWNKTVWLFSSEGNNGKGTFCQLLRNLLGPRAHCSIQLSDFGKDFALTPLLGKQAIITDENDVGTYIDKIALMKAVVTGDIITITKKFKDPINYRFHGMMVQCLNGYPKVKDKSDSFYRRQIFIPFEKSFEGIENKAIKDVYLNDPEVLEYVMKRVLDMKYYELSEPEVCKVALSGYKEDNDPIRQYWAEFEHSFAWDFIPYKFLFDLYKNWYDDNFPRAQQLSYSNFITGIRLIIKKESVLWDCDSETSKKRRPLDKMSKPEPIILEYRLKNWESKSYQGTDKKKRCTLTINDLAVSYAGIFKRNHSQ